MPTEGEEGRGGRYRMTQLAGGVRIIVCEMPSRAEKGGLHKVGVIKSRRFVWNNYYVPSLLAMRYLRLLLSKRLLEFRIRSLECGYFILPM